MAGCPSTRQVYGENHGPCTNIDKWGCDWVLLAPASFGCLSADTAAPWACVLHPPESFRHSQLPSRGSQLAMADSEVISQCNVPPHDTEVLLPGSLSIFVPHWILLHSGRRFPVPSFSLVVLISFCLLRRNIEGQACCRLELQNA